MRARIAMVLSWVLVPAYVVTWVWQVLLEASAYRSEGIDDELLALGLGGVVVVTTVMLRRRPDHPLTWLFAWVAVVVSLGPPLETYAEATIRTTGRPDALAWLGLWLNSWYWLPMLATLLVFVPLLFPDGRWPSPRWRWVGWTVVVLWGLITLEGMVAGQLQTQGREYADPDTLPAAFTCGPDEDDPSVVLCGSTWDNPLGLTGATSGSAFTEVLLLPAMVIGVAGGVTSVVVRFRRSRGVERQQMKWLVFATGFLPVPVVTEGIPVVGEVSLPLALAALPASIAVAVLRYRLWDIDRVVSRTVTYAVVTLVLAGTYAGLVLGMQAILGPEDASDLVVAGSTLVAAALFRPVRDRVQRLVDRRFDRARFDHDRILDGFAVRLRDEVDRDAVVDDLRGTVHQALAPSAVSLWLPTRSP